MDFGEADVLWRARWTFERQMYFGEADGLWRGRCTLERQMDFGEAPKSKLHYFYLYNII